MIKLTKVQTAWAISIDEAKDHLNITSSDKDDYITNFLIKAAQEACENFTGRKFNNGEYDYYLDKFPSGSDKAGVILLPYSPVIAWDENKDIIIKYDDTDNAEQTLVADTDYENDIIGEPARVIPIDNWPEVYEKEFNQVRISFKTGYTSPDFTPIAAIEAMYLLIGEMYLNRQDSVRRFPTAAQRLLMPLKVWL